MKKKLEYPPPPGVGGQNFFFRNSTRFSVRVIYMNGGTCSSTFFFVPAPLGPWGGAKRSNIIKSQSQSQFQGFLNQTLIVLSQMKDIKHIKRDFHVVAWVMPQGWGYRGGLAVKKMFSEFHQIWCVSYMNGTCNGTILWVPASWGLGEGPKIIKSQ